MRYQHRDGEEAHAFSLTAVRDTVRPDADGVFAVDEDRPDFDEVHARLVEEGHEPLDADDGDEDAAEAEDGTGDESGDDQDGAGDDAEGDPLRASDWTETELVEMGRQELRSIAAHYDDVDGNGSADALTEDLIAKRREEADGDGS